MDKELQKIILRIIKENNGIAEWRLILNKTSRNYWRENYPIKSDTIVKHQMDLLQEEDMLLRKDEFPNIFYVMTPSAHRIFDSKWKKLGRFILYDKNNLFILISLFISIGSLVVAIFALK